MNNKYFFFDLDGPLLDVSTKYFQVYRDILSGRGLNAIGKEEYWSKKRERVPEKEILSLTGAAHIFENYKVQRKELIETDHYLKYDRVQEGAYIALEFLSTRFRTVLVTLRSNPKQLQLQLQELGLDKFFSKILSADGDRATKWTIKSDLVKNELGSFNGSENNFFIGDTETDILAGKDLGCTTIGVLNGIRSEAIIRSLEPDFTIPGINRLFEHLKV